MQTQIVAGESVDNEELTRLSNALTRTLQRLKRRAPRTKSPLNPLRQHFSKPLSREGRA